MKRFGLSALAVAWVLCSAAAQAADLHWARSWGASPQGISATGRAPCHSSTIGAPSVQRVWAMAMASSSDSASIQSPQTILPLSLRT